MGIPLIFLEKGASRSFEIPTMTEMVQKFEEYLKANNSKDMMLYSEIKKTLSKGYDVSQIDIESIFSVLEGIAKDVTPEQMGHFPAYYMKKY